MNGHDSNAKKENKIEITRESVVTESIRKSSMVARDAYDYKKLVVPQDNLIPCSIVEEKETLVFQFQMNGLREIKEIINESEINQYQLLINFRYLEKILHRYQVQLLPENIYYDENYIPYLKHRDVYASGKGYRSDIFLYWYKTFVGGILSKKYDVKEVQEAGIEVLKKEEKLYRICKSTSMEEIITTLRASKNELLKDIKENKISINKSEYKKRQIISRVSIAILAVFSIYAGYHRIRIEPRDKATIVAQQLFIEEEYSKCIETLSKYGVGELDNEVKYILAICYAKKESFDEEQMKIIMSKITPDSEEKVFDYWIYLGRKEMADAENVASSLSDDQLLIYVYMKELDIVEADTSMDGKEKQDRIEELESNMKSLNDKYSTQE